MPISHLLIVALFCLIFTAKLPTQRVIILCVSQGVIFLYLKILNLSHKLESNKSPKFQKHLRKKDIVKHSKEVGRFEKWKLQTFLSNLWLPIISLYLTKGIVWILFKHIFYSNSTLQTFLESKHIHLQAWSPLACGKNGIFTNETLQSIAKAHHKSTAQIALKFLLDKGMSIIPKASSLKRLQENLTLFDFSLTQKERDSITQLDRNKSLFGWDC